MNDFNCTSLARESSHLRSRYSALAPIRHKWMQLKWVKLYPQSCVSPGCSRGHAGLISAPAVVHLFSNPNIFRVTLLFSVRSMRKTFYFIFLQIGHTSKIGYILRWFILIHDSPSLQNAKAHFLSLQRCCGLIWLVKIIQTLFELPRAPGRTKAEDFIAVVKTNTAVRLCLWDNGATFRRKELGFSSFCWGPLSVCQTVSRPWGVFVSAAQTGGQTEIHIRLQVRLTPWKWNQWDLTGLNRLFSRAIKKGEREKWGHFRL